MTRFKDHRKDLTPDHGGLDPLEESDFPAVSHRLILGIAFFKSPAIEIMKIRHITGTEECPMTVLTDAFHEKIRNPVGCVHVMSAAALITYIFP